MVCHLQSGLRTLTELFYKRTTSTEAGRELIFPHDGPYPRVKLLYTYLRTWFAPHCPVLIQPEKGQQRLSVMRFSIDSKTRTRRATMWREFEEWSTAKILAASFDTFRIFQARSMVKSFEVMETVNFCLSWVLLSSWSASDHLTYCTVAGTYAIWSRTCQPLCLTVWL